MMVQNLLPYLRFKYGQEVEKYFTQECIDANVGIEWDDEKKCVKSEIENNMTDDSQDADFIGLNQALKFVESTKQATEAKINSAINPSSFSSATSTSPTIRYPSKS